MASLMLDEIKSLGTILALRVDPQSATELLEYLFHNKTGKSFDKIHSSRLSVICKLLAKNNMGVDKNDKYAFLLDPDVSDKKATLLALCIETAIFQDMVDNEYSDEHVDKLLKLRAKIVKEHLNLASYMWLFGYAIPEEHLDDLVQIQKRFKDPAIGVVVENFKFFSIANTKSDAIEIIIDWYLDLENKFNSYKFSNIFTRESVRVDGYLKCFMTAFNEGYDVTLMEECSVTPRLSIEVFEWIKNDYLDTETVISQLLDLQNLDGNLRIVNIIDIMKAYRIMKQHCDAEGLPFPANTYRYTDVATIEALDEAYTTGKISTNDFARGLTVRDLNNIKNNPSITITKEFGSKVYRTQDADFKKFDFRFDKKVIDAIGQPYIRRLEAHLGRISILQNYYFDINEDHEIPVTAKPTYEYKLLTVRDARLQAEIVLPEGEFGGTTILVVIDKLSSNDLLPFITLYV